MLITSIVGARPQFVKMAVVCRVLRGDAYRHAFTHSIIHTGQHYDREMNDVFFSELDIPAPEFHLGVGSGTHGEQTGEMMKRLEPVLLKQRPDCVILYGDTNSTLAGAVVCAKIGIPTAHVEAGLRSYNRGMPEEINRVVADHLSEFLFCPTRAACENLEREGLAHRSVLSGDIMYDAALEYQGRAAAGPFLERFPEKGFVLATVHRAENTDDPVRLRSIFNALEAVAAAYCPVAIPLHPRTLKCIRAAGIEPRTIDLLPPLSYLQILALESRARFIITDSGGMQKEAYFMHVPCITTRDETEWIETLENGCNVLTGPDEQSILGAAARASQAGPWSNPYGDGRSCEVVLRTIQARYSHA